MNDIAQDPKELEMFSSIKGNFQVISFVGKMSKTSTAVLEACQTQVLNSPAKNIVLHFRDVTKIENPAIPFLVRMQKAVRDAKKHIRVTSLKPDMKEFLLTAAAVRNDEIFNNLPDALKSFPQ